MKLHLGCGNIHLDGWINIDARPTDATDLVMDISTLPNIEPGTVDEIYVCHVLEHFRLFNPNDHDYQSVLWNWVSKLKSGGNIKLSVPNVEAILKGLVDYKNDISKTYDFLRCLYGGQDYPGNIHYVGFTDVFLKDQMNVVLTDVKPFYPFIDDTSKFLLHGVDISLNYQGTKK